MLPLKNVAMSIYLAGEIARISGISADKNSTAILESMDDTVWMADLPPQDVFYILSFWMKDLDSFETDFAMTKCQDDQWTDALRWLKNKLTKTQSQLSWWAEVALTVLEARFPDLRRSRIFSSPSMN